MEIKLRAANKTTRDKIVTAINQIVRVPGQSVGATLITHSIIITKQERLTGRH